MADTQTLLAGFLDRLPGAYGTGSPVQVAGGRAVAQTAAVASVAALVVGTADALYEILASVRVTTATTHSFAVQCTYTDEGNTARTVNLPFRLVGGSTALVITVDNGQGTVPYLGVAVVIRVKAGTTITILTQAAGTYTTVVFNVEGVIRQVA
jgi:hypothetical protein